MSKIDIIDYETTDTDPHTCGIVQVSWLEFDTATCNYDVIFSKIMMPNVLIDVEASKVHGWTKHTLEVKGARPEEEVMTELCEKLIAADHRIVGGYNNIHFDDKITNRWLKQLFHTDLDDLGFESLDAMRHVIRTHPEFGTFKLGETYARFYNDYDDAFAHEATYDCKMTGKIIAAMSATPEQIAHDLKMPTPISVMPFGKFAGREFYRLPRGYMRHMLKLDLNPDIRLSMDQEMSKRPGKRS